MRPRAWTVLLRQHRISETPPWLGLPSSGSRRLELPRRRHQEAAMISTTHPYSPGLSTASHYWLVQGELLDLALWLAELPLKQFPLRGVSEQPRVSSLVGLSHVSKALPSAMLPEAEM